MKRPPCLAAIVDFDRTLLRTDKTISGYTVRILRTWQENGGRLFAATARPERAIGEYCRQIAFDAVCTLNGARTITKDSVIENPIPEGSALSVLEQLSGIPGIVLSVEAESGIYANMDIPPWAPKVTDRLPDLPRAEKIYKILASHPELPAEQLAVNLPDDTYFSVAEKKLLQVMSRSATKWNGICWTRSGSIRTGRCSSAMTMMTSNPSGSAAAGSRSATPWRMSGPPRMKLRRATMRTGSPGSWSG